jgi:hypothetical protein
MIGSAVLFIGYIVIGWVFTVVENRWTDFLSMTADPGFVLTGTLVSLFIVQATASPFAGAEVMRTIMTVPRHSRKSTVQSSVRAIQLSLNLR